MNPDDLETVYLPWFDRYIPVPEPLHHFSFVDFESICFEGTLSDFMVKAKSITPALAGNLTFRYAPCPDKKPDCEAMVGISFLSGRLWKVVRAVDAGIR